METQKLMIFHETWNIWNEVRLYNPDRELLLFLRIHNFQIHAMSPNQLLLLLKQNFNNNSNFYIFFAKEQTKPLLLYKNTVTEQHLMNIMEMRYITIVETNVMYDYCDIIITKIIILNELTLEN